MRWSLFILLVLLITSLYGQQDYSLAEVEAFAEVTHARALQKEAEKDQPPPGLDSSGMSYERYGKIVRSFLTGDEPALTREDSMALSTIRTATENEEEQRIAAHCTQHGLTVTRYRQLDQLARANKEFAVAYRKALFRLEQNRKN